jgi:predicted GIY-YIG superfamily endonuclease
MKQSYVLYIKSALIIVGYNGVTSNLESRMYKTQCGVLTSTFLKRRPLELVYCEFTG